MVAMITGAVAASAPAIAHGVHAMFANNADKLDGKHAVGAGATINYRRGKLVTTKRSTGRLPNNIIAKAPNAARLGGLKKSAFVQGRGKVYTGRVVTERGGGSKLAILAVPGFAEVQILNCFNLANVQLTHFVAPLDVWRELQSGALRHDTVPGVSAHSTPPEETSHIVWYLARGEDAAAVSARIDVWWHATGSECLFSAAATVTRG